MIVSPLWHHRSMYSGEDSYVMVEVPGGGRTSVNVVAA